ncbi:MAG TPA: DPP IV N-terminal domain-containing protein, partial [Actinomycetota bacterium]|nr:DPP IV N-terminal domain-containing protein [Actinomycetota bacterium]
PKSVAVIACAFGLLISLLPTEPRAKAAARVRNGRIAISVLRPPFTSIPAPPPGELPVLGDRDLFTLSPTGGAFTQITSGPDIDVTPVWSPDGRKLAFVRDDPTYGKVSSGDIYTLEADGTGERNLTNTPLAFEKFPSWSPDASKIVFVSDRGFPNLTARLLYLRGGETDLYVMDADGGNVVRLTSDPGYEEYPVWSPNGRWLAFGDLGTIILMTADGSAPRPLAQGLFPQWSPDGRRIAFISDDDVHVIDVFGGDERNVTSDHPGSVRFATWSPDGRWLTFISDRRGPWRLYKMRPNGSQVRELIDIDLHTPNTSISWGRRP